MIEAGGAHADCPFCDYAGPSEIIRDFGDAFVIEPLRQITPGHVMVVPRVHIENFATAPRVTALVFETAATYWRSANRFGEANLITSKGKAATQSVFHFHVHVVPRSEGDGLTLPWRNPHDEKGGRS